MRPLKLDRILAADALLQPVLAKAHELRALAVLLDAFLPPELARQTRIASYRDGQLTLLAASPAAAAKLRLLAPTLAKFFSEQRWQVNSVSTKVQPNASRESIVASHKTLDLSTSALDSLSRLYATMRRSPARDALRVLLERRGAIPAGPPRQTRAGPPVRRKQRT
ncbi:MAG TPA: DciA family protein [Burkholderiales bacterium]|nr:DciA family protein [Burkholderiales bacterium]